MDCTTTLPELQDTLGWALLYASLGFRVFPVWKAVNGKCTCHHPDTCTDEGKHPRTRNGLDGGTTKERQIRGWKWESANIGIATGAESNLVVVDVDSEEARQWIKDNLSEIPPTSIARTGGGWHLLFRHPGGYVPSTHEGKIHIRADGGFIVAPPSVHKSERHYEWLHNPKSMPPAIMPPDWAANLLKIHDVTPNAPECTESTLNAPNTPNSPEIIVSRETKKFPDSSILSASIQEAIRTTLPSDTGQRHYKIFQFARKLKAIPEITPLSADDLMEHVQEWHRQCLDKIGTKDFEPTWSDFQFAWEECQYAWGENRMAEFFANAMKADLPEKAVALYGRSSLRARLAAICRALQVDSGKEPFFLSSRQAAEVLRISSMHSARWLKMLCKDGILEEVSKGNMKERKASEYRYLAD